MTPTATGVLIRASCTAPHVAYPSCATPSRRVHGRYERTLLDLPAAGREVLVRLRVRRFRCATPVCPVKTFTEQINGVSVPWARRTVAATAALAQIGLVLAGRAGARLATGLGMAVGRGVLLRIVHGLPDPVIGTITALGGE